MEVAGRGLEPPSPSYLAEQGHWAGRAGRRKMWSWHPELLALPLSLSFPSQGANQSRDGSVRAQGAGWPSVPRWDRV